MVNSFHIRIYISRYLTFFNWVIDNLFDKGLFLPSGSNLTKQEKFRISESLLKILG